MSGPKCGHVQIRDRELLERQRRLREESDARELARLERQASRERRDEQRLADLRAKEERRQERERQRAEESARVAEQQRQREEALYQRAKAGLDAALARRPDLLRRFEGLVLPAAPEPLEAARDDAGHARRATAELMTITRNYQDAVDRALLDWHRTHEAAASKERAGALAAQMRVGAARTAADVISALDPDQPSVQASLRDSNLALRCRRANELVSRLGEGMPWKDRLEISEASLGALADVLSAGSEPEAQAAMFRLKDGLQADAQAADQAHRAEEKERAAARAEQERARRENDRQLVEATIRDALQDLGYHVGEVEETAVVKDGQLYFSRADWPKHAVQVTLDDQLAVRLEPVRLADGRQAQGPADLAEAGKADVAFDGQWCSESGLGKLKERLRDRGMALPLQAEKQPGGSAMRRVPDASVGKALRKARGAPDEAPAPIARQLPGSR